MKTSEVLYTAADLIEERGWVQGQNGWNVTDGLCLEGGIMAAAGHSDRIALWGCPAYNAVADYLDIAWNGGGPRCVWRFNDITAKSATEVIEVLRAAAVIEAAKEQAEVRESAPITLAPESSGAAS